ncbi:MAG: helix-turn-helix domain-containing protein [Desulfovibrio sp.]|nr:helix-turn-helix domain-containing protein [Desulfovibrio sp.]
MSEKTFTHKALADLLGVSETTVKSYRRKFPGCIPVFTQGKPIRFTADAAAVGTRIRDFFEIGMSVKEVRARLAQEFAWISPEQPKISGKNSLEISPEISTGVSNMAKSMVAMTQQQKALLSRMQGIESLLEELGFTNGRDPEELRRRKLAAVSEREMILEERLDRLDATTRDLADNLSSLADRLGRFLGQRDSAAESWTKEDAADALATAAQLVEKTAGAAPSAVRKDGQENLSRAPFALEMPPPPAPKVISLHGATHAGKQSNASDFLNGRGADSVSGFADALQSEPPRHFFSLPLVVRTGQGHYVSAGGRGRGRFSINDLKAMLIYGYTPPNHFTLRWERHGQGWWFHLEQHTGQLAYHLLLMEMPSPKGGTMAEVLQLKKNDDPLHPAEICAVIDSFGA